MINSIHLLGGKRFLPFFLTQFAGAFNDNLYKNSLTIFIAFHAVNMDQQNSHIWINLAAGLFILPYFLFSPLAGQVALKFEKAQLIRRIKIGELCIMCFGAVAFYLQSPLMLVSILFLMGTQSALFGPVKYSLIPQALKADELVAANALVSFGTFVAILLGLLLGAVIISQGITITGLAIIATAAFGYLAARQIPSLPAPLPDLKIDYNLPKQIGHLIRTARSNADIFTAVLGISWFWFVGSTYVTQLPNFVRYELGANDQVYLLMITGFTVGIGIGAFLCEWLSKKGLELGLVVLGGLGISLFGFDLFFAKPEVSWQELVNVSQFLDSAHAPRVIADIVLLGTMAGLYIVPLLVQIQRLSESDNCAQMFAANNILNALFMVSAAVAALILLSSGLSVGTLFLWLSVANLLYLGWLIKREPAMLRQLLKRDAKAETAESD